MFSEEGTRPTGSQASTTASAFKRARTDAVPAPHTSRPQEQQESSPPAPLQPSLQPADGTVPSSSRPDGTSRGLAQPMTAIRQAGVNLPSGAAQHPAGSRPTGAAGESQYLHALSSRGLEARPPGSQGQRGQLGRSRQVAVPVRNPARVQRLVRTLLGAHAASGAADEDEPAGDEQAGFQEGV